MKLYSKRLITLLLTSSISLSTMSCAIIKSTETEGLKVINKESEDKNYTIEVVEDKSIIFIQESAVRAITNAEILNSNNEVIGYLPAYEELKVNEKYDDLYQVYYNDELAYIKSSDVIEDYITTPENNYISVAYINEDTSIYSDTNESSVVKELNKYEAAYIYYGLNDYYYVLADNNIGFVKKDKLTNLEGTFVVVDISSQTLNLYQNNEVTLSSPVVTGKVINGESITPVGIYEIYDITKNRELVGPGYRSYVDYMMKFNKNIGLHDTEYHADYNNGKIVKKHGWRDKQEFGGYTFIKHGSHGCVNMPHDATVFVNENVNIGTKVLVKK